MSEQQINRFASVNHGLINRRTAHKLGLTDRQIAYRVSQSRWSRLWPTVFAISGSAHTPAQTLLGAVMHSDGVASHLSAAWLLGLRDLPPALPQVSTAPGGGRSSQAIKIHQSRDLHVGHTTNVNRIRTTDATRTILDLAGQISCTELQILFDRALRFRLTHADKLTEYFLQTSRSGRPGAAALRRFLKGMNLDLALAESDLVLASWRVLRFTWRQICYQSDWVVGQVREALELGSSYRSAIQPA
ncbi:MAG: hypothetical protein WD029_00850 [Microthrixaceae bacterium]